MSRVYLQFVSKSTHTPNRYSSASFFFRVSTCLFRFLLGVLSGDELEDEESEADADVEGSGIAIVQARAHGKTNDVIKMNTSGQRLAHFGMYCDVQNAWG